MRAAPMVLLALLLAVPVAVAYDPGAGPAADGNCGADPVRCVAMVYYCSYVLVAHANGLQECLTAVR